MGHEPSGAEQPLLLAGPRDEQHRTTEARAVALLGHADQQRHVRGIVERAVVQPVAVHRRAVSVAVEMRGQDDRLIGHRGIAAGKKTDDVRRHDLLRRDGERRVEAIDHVEGRQRRALAAVGDQSRRIVAVAADHLLQRIGVERETHEGIAVALRAREPHGARVGEGPARWFHHEAGVGDRHDADGASRPDHRFAGRRARQLTTSRAVTDHELAAHVAERVGRAVAAKGEWRVDRFRQRLGRLDHEVVQQHQRSMPGRTRSRVRGEVRPSARSGTSRRARPPARGRPPRSDRPRRARRGRSPRNRCRDLPSRRPTVAR